LGDLLAVFLQQQGLEHVLALAATELGIAAEAGGHVLEGVGDEEGFEILRRGPGLCHVLGVDRGRCFLAQRTEAVERRGGEESVGGDRHHCTVRSACRAPAVLMVCRMEIMSRGLTPSELRPATSCSSVTPGSTTASLRLASSCTSTLVRGTTTVTPVLENGLGCETCGVSVMRMVR